MKDAVDVPMFLLKLTDLLQTEDLQKYVSWNDNGTSFIIKDEERLSNFVLPKYFKHNRFGSFVRQLNLYGFRKVSTINQDLYNQKRAEEFRHQFFLKDRSDLLGFIKRRSRSVDKHAEEISQVLEEMQKMKDTLMEVTSSLLDVKKENDNNLRREVVSLRKQQKAVNHLLNYRVNPEQHQNRGMDRKRNHVITWKGDSSDSFEPPPKVANKTFDDVTSRPVLLDDVVKTEASSPGGMAIAEDERYCFFSP